MLNTREDLPTPSFLPSKMSLSFLFIAINLKTTEHRRTLFGIAMETVVLLAMDVSLIRKEVKCVPSNKSEQMKKRSIIVIIAQNTGYIKQLNGSKIALYFVKHLNVRCLSLK